MNNIDPDKRQPEDKLDRLIDAELTKYANVDPRSGLDERILANLRSRQPVAHSWWHWGLAAAVAAILVVLASSLGSNRPHPAVENRVVADHAMSDHPMPDHPQKNSSQPNPSPEVQPSADGDPGVVWQGTPRPVLRARALRHKTKVPKNPKLDQFPSPQPLSAEEIALARYVRDFPKDAQLVAAAQREFDLETEKEMNHDGSETRPPSGSIQQDSIQQER